MSNVLYDQAKKIRTLEAQNYLLQLVTRERDRKIARLQSENEALKMEIRK